MKNARSRLFLTVLTISTFGCSETVEVRYVHPRRQDLASHLTTNGRIEASNDSALYAETTGRIAQLAVKEGNRVRQGDLVATIDDREARASLEQAEARVAAARAQLATVEKGGSPAQTAELKDQLDRARRKREKLQQDVDALGRLVEQQAVPATQLEAARRELADTQSEIALLETKLEVRISADERAQAEASVREAQAAVTLARQKAGSASLRSPIAGVVYSIPVRSGAFIGPGALVARVGVVDPARVLIFVDEPELGRLQLGEKVTLTADAHPGQQWECEVDRLPSEVVALETRRVGEAWCTAGNADGKLIPNLTVNARILTGLSPNALTLPREAIVRENGQTLVWVVNEQQIVERRPVILGLSSATQVEVSGGVAESDRVLLPGTQPLVAGQTVRAVESSI
jgi:HlyD family secretion protein